VVLVTHDVEEAAFLASAIIVMEKGRGIARLENPLARGNALRDRMEFYAFCLEVRRAVGVES
jgi:ABC-type nitrate/sulfonate/bicarbonate transport system ATPase subunit